MRIGYVTLHKLKGGNFHTLKHFFCSTIPEENEVHVGIKLSEITKQSYLIFFSNYFETIILFTFSSCMFYQTCSLCILHGLLH